MATDQDPHVLQAKRLLRVQRAIAGHIAGATSSTELLELVLATIGETLDWSWGAAWRPAADERLHCRATWHAPGTELSEFEATVCGKALARGEGVPGQVWEYREPVWMEDVSQDPALVRESAAPAAGLATAVAFPLSLGPTFEGVIEFFAPDIREPDADLLAMFAATGAQLAQRLERQRAERELREERDRAHRYLEVAGTMIVVLDADGRVALINPKGCDVLGWDADDLVGRDWFETVVPPGSRPSVREAFEEILAGHLELFEHYENPVRTRDGGERTIAWRHAAIRDEDGKITGTVSSGDDVTDRRRAEREVAYLAYHDRLTGLPNRTLLEEHLGLAMARASRHGHSVATLYLDLDNFKLVNDSFGHSAGDQLLREAAVRLRTATRASDLLARQGGDEFLLLLTDLGDDPEATCQAVAEKLEDVLREPFELAGAEFQIGASIGVSIYPRDADDGEELLRHADAAMYQAKRAGRGRVVIYASETGDPLERLSLSTRLRRALEQEELRLCYQPVVRLDDGEVVGLEALVRWEDPERGIVPPNDFIPLAEESGLIVPLGEWVMEAVLRQTAAWTEAGLRPHVSFNLSPHQLHQPGLARTLGRRIHEMGIAPSSLGAEVTESAASLEIGPALRELSDLGLRLAVDDFGAGYSSLARLRTLPVQIVKIDRSFMAEIPVNREAGAIVASVIRLAGALGKIPVAEGVETEAQRRFLLEHGCPLAQGFLLAAPMGANDATALLTHGRAVTV